MEGDETVARLRQLAEAARAAHHQANQADVDLEEAARAAREQEQMPWSVLAAATGLSADTLRWRLERRHDPRDDRHAQTTPVRRANDNPQAGLSLGVAAQQLGVNRQTLRNRLAAASASPGQPVEVAVDGQTVTVVAGEGREPWRVWIGEAPDDQE